MATTETRCKAQEGHVHATPPALVVADSGRQIYLPAISMVYLGRRDEKRNIFPHVDLTHDGGDTFGVSRRHARIHQNQEGTFIEDVGSTNGTFVNGQKLNPSRAYPLCHGDVLHLGQLKLKVTWIKAWVSGE